MTRSSVNMVPSKLEINLRKADQVAWGKLEDPNYKAEPEPVDEPFIESNEPQQPDWDIDDDDISDSDEEWARDEQVKAERTQEQIKEEEMQKLKRKEVEEEMKMALEERMKAEEEKKRLEEQRRQDEGYEDMPDLE